MAVRDWGYRYLMFDFNNRDYESEDDTVTIEQGIHSRFQAVRQRVGPGIFIEACMIWPGPVLGVADGYRPGPDWRGCRETRLTPFFVCRNHYHGRFFQCDSEFMHPGFRPFTWHDWRGQPDHRNARPRSALGVIQCDAWIQLADRRRAGECFTGAVVDLSTGVAGAAGSGRGARSICPFAAAQMDPSRPHARRAISGARAIQLEPCRADGANRRSGGMGP